MTAFNGAALFRARKWVRGPKVQHLYEDPSMGPRFLGRGNITEAVAAMKEVEPSMGPRFLGRGNVTGGNLVVVVERPSMGPRFLGRGNDSLTVGIATMGAPSMGPRFLGRGNQVMRYDGKTIFDLQWGRAF